MRSLAHKAGEYTEVLQRAGVPVSSQSSAGYFATTEVTDCISLLKVLDNPQRDIELAAVLRSPVFGVTDNELAGIRVDYRSTDGQEKALYDTLIWYCNSGPDKTLQEKLKAHLDRIEAWRLIARLKRPAELVWHLLRDKKYLSFVSALPNGRQRRANLLKLHERAIQFESFATSTRAASLSRFVES